MVSSRVFEKHEQIKSSQAKGWRNPWSQIRKNRKCGGLVNSSAQEGPVDIAESFAETKPKGVQYAFPRDRSTEYRADRRWKMTTEFAPNA